MSKYPNYNWQASESAPKEYVMQIIDGHFTNIDGTQKGIPTRVTLNNGWGVGRSTIVAGADEMALPNAMELTWFSFREDTFFRARFDLPYKKIAEIFSDEKAMPYSGHINKGGNFVVGIAPEGFVTLWVKANQNRYVVFTGFAEPVADVPWQAVFNNPDFSKEEIIESTVQETLAEAKGSPYLNQPKYWQQLHSELFEYQLVIEGDYTPYSVSVAYLDQTSSSYYHEERQHYQLKRRSAITSITFDYLFSERIAVVPISKINTDEMLVAFRQLSNDGASPLRVVVSIDGDLLGWGYRPRIRVENDEAAIEINDFGFRAIDSSDMLRALPSNKHMQKYVNRPGKPASP